MITDSIKGSSQQYVPLAAWLLARDPYYTESQTGSGSDSVSGVSTFYRRLTRQTSFNKELTSKAEDIAWLMASESAALRSSQAKVARAKKALGKGNESALNASDQNAKEVVDQFRDMVMLSAQQGVDPDDVFGTFKDTSRYTHFHKQWQTQRSAALEGSDTCSDPWAPLRSGHPNTCALLESEVTLEEGTAETARWMALYNTTVERLLSKDPNFVPDDAAALRLHVDDQLAGKSGTFSSSSASS